MFRELEGRPLRPSALTEGLDSVVIVSSGMIPIIRAIMENLVGVEVCTKAARDCHDRPQLESLQDAAKIDIIANDVEHLPNGSWTIKYRHPER